MAGLYCKANLFETLQFYSILNPAMTNPFVFHLNIRKGLTIQKRTAVLSTHFSPYFPRPNVVYA